ncbi:MAG: hypothetical protein JWN24_2593 [Phycisphaerales bacterium]|nr:hypothetical protein [Phycisphaerales bacterium]
MRLARRRLSIMTAGVLAAVWLATAPACRAESASDGKAELSTGDVTATAAQIDRIIADLGDPDPEKRKIAQLLVRNLPAAAYEPIRDRLKDEGFDAGTQIELAHSMKMLAVRYLKEKRMKQALAWWKQQAMAAYDGEGDAAHDVKWDVAARAALAQLGERLHEGEFSDAAAKLVALTRVVDSGCNDPLVVAIQTTNQLNWQLPPTVSRGSSQAAAWPATGLTPGMNDRMRAAAQTIRQGDYPALFKCIAYQAVIRTILMSNGDQNEGRRYLSASLDALPQALQTPGFPVEPQMSMVMDQIQLQFTLDPKHDREAPLRRMHTLYAAIAPASSGPPLVMAKMSMGIALNIRGNAPEDQVAPETLELYRKWLANAEDALETGWKLDPKAWRVPAEMISVKIGQGESREEMEKWFKRAMDADPDNLEACLKKLYYLAPGRRGSEEDMLAFGRECLATGNFRGRIAFVLIDAHMALAYRITGEGPAYFRRPGVWASIKPVYDSALKVFPHSTFDRSMYAKLAYEGGEYAEAHRQFALLGEAADLNVFDGSENYDRARLVAAMGALAPAPADPAQPAGDEFAAALQEAASDATGQGNLVTALRSVAQRFQQIEVGTEPAKTRWQKVTLNAKGKGIDCIRFRTPKGARKDMRWAFVMGNGRLASWYIIRADPANMNGFSEFNPMPAEHVKDLPGPGDGGKHGLTIQQLPADRLVPDTEYLIWFRFQSAASVRTSIAINFVPPAPNGADWRVLLRDLGLHWVGDP